jgi:hypothetical protein
MAKNQTAPAAPTSELPEGFEMVTGQFPDAWDFDAEPVLTGEWMGSRDAQVKQGTKTVTRLVANIRTADGQLHALWESAGLAGLFDKARLGDVVWIRFDGLGTPKPGMNAPKLFTTAIKPGAPF